jgi:hypothetical protein
MSSSLSALSARALLAAALLAPAAAVAQHSEAPIIGNWDFVLTTPNGPAPSWLEVLPSGNGVLVGRFLGIVGSARPVSRVTFENNAFRFAVPPQWERGTADLQVEGTLASDTLTGTVTMPDGQKYSYTATRAPSLVRTGAPKWGTPVALFNGKDLGGWTARGQNKWNVANGILSNGGGGANLVSDAKFDDFKLHVEFRYPSGSNSGIYLRGRYEVQIEDNFGQEPDSHRSGGVYGFLTPSLNASKKAGEWQTVEITLVGRVVTVMLNGERVIDRQSIPGITGGALDSHEGEPGPILLQGDHGRVEFRKLTLTPGE